MRYAWQEGVEAARMQEETVLLNPTTKKFCILNATAAHLWTLLEQPRNEGELVDALCQAFAGVTRQTAESDVRDALQQLVALGVIRAVASNGDTA